MADRNTAYMAGDLISLRVAASVKIESGHMVAINSNGWAVHAADAAGCTVIGMADEAVDNRSGSDGAALVTVRRGKVFRFANSASHPVAQANVGGNVYIEDSQTVAADGGANNVIAGQCMSVTAKGVWVHI